jgi:ElaB/YqjD/DUF883 family membrane-anchored ribosome-binding protein
MSKDFENFEEKAKDIFDDLYQKLEGRIKNLTDQVKDNLIPDAEEKLRKNVFKTVFVSFGIGFVFGIIVTFFGFIKSGKKK